MLGSMDTLTSYGDTVRFMGRRWADAYGVAVELTRRTGSAYLIETIPASRQTDCRPLHVVIPARMVGPTPAGAGRVERQSRLPAHLG